MRISIGLASIEVSRSPSVWEARSAAAGSLEIEEACESDNGPVYVLAKNESIEEGRVMAVGIQMESEYEIPSLLGVSWGEAYWVGCNFEIYRISHLMSIEKKVPLDSKFSSFYYLAEFDRLIVIAETAVICIDANGIIAWRVDVDIITD